MKLPSFYVTILAFAISCKSITPSESSGGACYSFDIRQCQMDEFATEILLSEPKVTRESKMKDWLQSKGIVVHKIKLQIGYHEMVCQACDICPEQDRYFVQLGDKNGQINNLKLLNKETFDCIEVF